ncbi:MAG: STAS domain-containing protein [Clostridia bacterium]|nr:STAS domain-containing protein [Clostridia bacterium]
MQSTIKKENGTLFIGVTGRLDTVTSAELMQTLEVEGFDGVDIDFDFAGVEYISSAGLRLILALHKQSAETANTLTVRNVNKVVAEILKVSGFDKSLNIV